MSLARLDWAIPGVFVLALPGIPEFGAADAALPLLIVLRAGRGAGAKLFPGLGSFLTRHR